MKILTLAAFGLVMCVASSGGKDCSPPAWGEYVPPQMEQREELISFLTEFYLAHCQCDFPESVLSRMTGGAGSSRPSEAEVSRYCAGKFRILDVTGNGAGSMATAFLRSAKRSFYKGDEVQVTLVLLEGSWRAYIPRTVTAKMD